MHTTSEGQNEKSGKCLEIIIIKHLGTVKFDHG